jgi:subfamily B ATP-binding cassette protein MsbA
MKKTPKPTSLVRRFGRGFLMPFWPLLVGAALCMVIDAALMLVLVNYAQPLVDDVLSCGQLRPLIPIVFIIIGASILRGGVEYAHALLMTIVGQRSTANFQAAIFGRLIKTDLAFFTHYPSGGLLSLLTYDTQLLRVGITQTMVSLVRDGLTVIFLTFAMFQKDFVLASVACVLLPLLLFPMVHLARFVRRISTASQEAMASMNSFFQEAFHGVRVIKAYGMEDTEAELSKEKINTFVQLKIRSSRARAMIHPIMETLGGITLVAVILYGGYQVVSGAKTPGALMSFLLALVASYKPFKKVADLNTYFQEILASLKRLFEAYDTKPHVKDLPDAKPLLLGRGDISFENIHFTYPGSEQKVFKDFSCHIKGGTRVAFVGPSGSGKSTLFNLLLRFYDLDFGHIVIDKQSIRDITIQSLREHIAFVGQDFSLFDATVVENITYGTQEASDKAIREASQAAFADAFIQELPQGYETRVGERGQILSGGQRQRVAIARAFLRNAPILLLDEATSALDTQSELWVQRALDQLMEGRTTLMIAHRLSTVEKSDCIFVMNHGQIVEEGTHEQLLKKSGLYAKLVIPQLYD